MGPMGVLAGPLFNPTAGIAAASTGPDSVDLFVVDRDNQVRQHRFRNRDWDADWPTIDGSELDHSSIERFVSAQPDGGIRADRLILGPWERFVIHELQDLSGGAGTAVLVAVQSHTGLFLCAESGGGRELVANRSVVGNWEMFKMLPSPINPNKRVFQALGGHYWCADGGGDAGVDCTRINADAWESFLVVKL